MFNISYAPSFWCIQYYFSCPNIWLWQWDGSTTRVGKYVIYPCIYKYLFRISNSLIFSVHHVLFAFWFILTYFFLHQRQQQALAINKIDLTYVPHHGNSNYSYVDFFKRIRARYYVFSGIEPSKEVYNALLEAKQTWEDKELGTDYN